MSLWKVTSKDLIPYERCSISDINTLIDQYSNVEYNRIYDLVHGGIIKIIKTFLNPVIKFEIDNILIDTLIGQWVTKFGWTYREFEFNFKNSGRNLQIEDSIFYDFTLFLQKSVINTNHNIEECHLCDQLTYFIIDILKIWAKNEGYVDISEIDDYQ